MTNSIEPIPILTGKDAERFLREKKRVEELKPDDKEAVEGAKFRKECLKIYRENPW